MPWFDIIDAACKIAGAFASIGTLGLIWMRAIPKINEIHEQTNGLTRKVEIAAHAAGVLEGRKISRQAIAAAAELKAVAADVRDALRKNGDSQ